jgi:hypothetical protein
MSSTDLSQGSVHALPILRATATATVDDAPPPELISPKQQMLDSVDVLRARIDAGFVTGFQLFAGTRLGEPVEDLAAGSFAHSPLDTALLMAHSLYRRLYALKEADLAAQSAALRQRAG